MSKFACVHLSCDAFENAEVWGRAPESASYLPTNSGEDFFRYWRLAPELRSGCLYDTLLWISFIAVASVGLLAGGKLFQ